MFSVRTPVASTQEAYFFPEGTVAMANGSNGTYDGQPAYMDNNPDGTLNIFPGGHPSQNPDHDHIVANQDGGVTYMREGGEVTNNYRDRHNGQWYND